MYIKDFISRLRKVRGFKLFYLMFWLLSLIAAFIYTNVMEEPGIVISTAIFFVISIIIIDFLNIKLSRITTQIQFILFKVVVFLLYIGLLLSSSLLIIGNLQFEGDYTLPNVIFLALVISYFPTLILYIVKEISKFPLIEYLDFANIRRVVLIILLLMFQFGDNGNDQYTIDIVIVVGFILAFNELTTKFKFDEIQVIKKNSREYEIHPSLIMKEKNND